MKRTRRTTRITVETERFLSLRKTGASSKRIAWCAVCGAERRLVTPAEAPALAGASDQMIYQLVESGALHFAEHEDGRVLVCLDSLAKQSQNRLR
jgi:hypothetical protein